MRRRPCTCGPKTSVTAAAPPREPEAASTTSWSTCGKATNATEKTNFHTGETSRARLLKATRRGESSDERPTSRAAAHARRSEGFRSSVARDPSSPASSIAAAASDDSAEIWLARPRTRILISALLCRRFQSSGVREQRAIKVRSDRGWRRLFHHFFTARTEGQRSGAQEGAEQELTSSLGQSRPRAPFHNCRQ